MRKAWLAIVFAVQFGLALSRGRKEQGSFEPEAASAISVVNALCLTFGKLLARPVSPSISSRSACQSRYYRASHKG
jgi:hypothetical protein